MTKYILNSGGLKNQPEKAKLFLAEILKGLGQSPKILLCFFASAREDWETKFSRYQDFFTSLAPEGTTIKFELAFPGSFTEQVKTSDAIIIHGGDFHLLNYWMSSFSLPQIFEGKIVAGSSAGSELFATAYWTCDWRQCMDGLGILPIKFIPHFQSNFGATDPRGPIDWNAAYTELSTYGDTTLPIHALAEGEYIVVEQ